MSRNRQAYKTYGSSIDNFHSPSYSSPLGFKGLNRQAEETEGNMQMIISNLLRKNQQLQDRLHQEKARTFDLMQLKRRMQQDLKKMQFEFERISEHENLHEKQQSIKNYQLGIENKRINDQLNRYHEENRALRQQIRKSAKEIQEITRQKEILEKQNFNLIREVQELKQKTTKTDHQYDYMTIKQSERGQQFLSPQSQPAKSYSYQSTNIPKTHQKRVIDRSGFTNESLEKINEQFYQDQNNNCMRKIDYKVSSHFDEQCPENIIQNSKPATKFYSQHQNYYSDRRDQVHLPNADFQKGPVETNVTQNIHLQESKKQIKGKVSELRDQLILLLLKKPYLKSVSDAETQKLNALKLFIQQMLPISQTVLQMSSNYLQARQAFIEVCPTARKKWLDEIPTGATSNDMHVFNIYKNVKTNSKKQQQIGGQFLALFRLLTILNKVNEEEIDKELIGEIKHWIVKLVYKINIGMEDKKNRLEEILGK